ncbi:MAG: undecaprenyl-diphosphatase UppP [Dissulfuribacterales bacterium]
MIINIKEAIILGIVEGVTEFLPVSSTGHLILTSHLLGLDVGDGKTGLDAFEVVIQSGALLAVFSIYTHYIYRIWNGIFGRDSDGLKLLQQLFVAVVPALVMGYLFSHGIKERLFGIGPVLFALIAGGILMMGAEYIRKRRNASVFLSLEDMDIRNAFIIGLAQCLALWPGTSRSMVTMVAAMLLGFSPKAAAEFSFLLALPTLGAATLYDLYKHGGDIIHVSGMDGLFAGVLVSWVVAWLAVKAFLLYLTRHGMFVFGVYRILLAVAMSFTI